MNYLEHDGGSLSNPTPEHFLPLLYVLGAWDGQEVITTPVDGIEMGSLSMLSVQVVNTCPVTLRLPGLRSTCRPGKVKPPPGKSYSTKICG